MAKSYLSLQATEGVLVQAAAQIYSAYIISGRAAEGEEAHWMKKAISEAIQIAKTTDENVIADDEVG